MDVPFIAVAGKEGRYERDCYNRCGSVYGFSGPDFTYCLDECRVGGQARSIDYSLDEITPVSGIDYKKVPDVVSTFIPEFAEKKPVEFYVRECYKNCEVAHGSSGANYSVCLIGCSLGGQIPQVTEVKTREARGYDSCATNYCGYVYYVPLAFGPCMGVCLAAGGRRRSIEYPLDEVTPVTDVDYKKVPVVPTFTPEVVDKKPVEFYVKECYNRCAVVYKSTDPDYATCLLGCTVGGQKPKETPFKVDFVGDRVIGVKEAGQ